MAREAGPYDASPERYHHNRTGEDNGDAHHKRQVMGREVVVAVTAGKLDFGPWEPRALAADRRAFAKSMVERPLLRAIAGIGPDGRRRLLAEGASPRAVARFDAALRRDTEYNEGVLHASIHGWYAQRAVDGFEALNERVYAELFLTPRSDPWLGLAGDAAYAALPLSAPRDGGAARGARSSP